MLRAVSPKEAWFLHPERGWLHVKLEGRIVKVGGLAEPAQHPYVSPLAAKQGFASQVSTALSRGYTQVSEEDVSAWRAKSDASPSPEVQAQRDVDWQAIGHDPAQGFSRLEVALPEGDPPDLVRLLADPRLEGLEDLRVRSWRVGNRTDYGPWLLALGGRPLGRLRSLELDDRAPSEGAPSRQSGTLDALLRTQPVLDTLSVTATVWLDAPTRSATLRALRIDGAAAEPRIASLLAGLDAPALVSLRLHPGYEGDVITASQVQAFFARDDLPSLRQLELFGLENDPEVFSSIARSTLLRRLEGLTLQGGFGPEAADSILEYVGAFDHLHRLGVDPEVLSPEVEDMIPKAFGTYG